jgi:hypothetical protein
MTCLFWFEKRKKTKRHKKNQISIGFSWILFYIEFMIVTVEVKNQKTFDLLRAIEGLGLINVNSPVPPWTAEKEVHEEMPPYNWLRGC